MNRTHEIFRRPGRFAVPRDIMEGRDIEPILVIQRDVFIVGVTYDFLTDKWEFQGYSMQFRKVPPEEIIPYYMPVVTSPIPGVYNVTWEKLPELHPEPRTPPEPPAPWWRRLWNWWCEEVR